MEINIEQYQALYLIPTGITSEEYTKTVLDIFKIDGETHTVREITKILNSIKVPTSKQLKKFRIKIDGVTYGIVNDIMKATYNEWIQYDSIVGSSPDEATIIKNLHKILAIYVRPIERKLFKKKMVPLDKLEIDINEKAMLKMRIEDALSVNVFFYLREQNFIQRTKMHYLNLRTRKATV
jgi:hypothetical protein